MEYCEFPNLKILISRNDPVLEQYVGNILIDVAEALSTSTTRASSLRFQAGKHPSKPQWQRPPV